MSIDNKYLKKVLFFLICIISSLLLLSFVHPTLYLDEQYTLSLIHHSYGNLININMLDVHPPTYYILLKFFLSISTFWTHSILVKIFFARLFSFVLFILMFLILHKILIICNFYVNWKIQFIYYLLLVPINFNSINIRMYSLYGLLNVLTYYYLLLYRRDNVIKYLVLAMFFACFTVYTDYFAGICVGVFLIITFIRCILNKKFKQAIYLVYSSTILLIICIPIGILLFNQIKLRSKYPLANKENILNAVINSFSQTSNIYSSIFLCTIFILAAFYSYIIVKRRKFNNILSDALLNYLITIIFSLILCFNFNVFEFKFTYPQFTIYSFCIISIIIKINKHKYLYFMKVFVIILLMLMDLFVTYKNVKQYVKPSYNVPLVINKKSKNVYLNYYKLPNMTFNGGKSLYITEYSTFLQYYHKKLVVSNCNEKEISLNIVNGKNKLLRETFNNLKFKS